MKNTCCLLFVILFLSVSCSVNQPVDPEKKTSPPSPVLRKIDPKNRKFPLDTVIYREAAHRTITMAKSENLSKQLDADPVFQKARTENRFQDICNLFFTYYAEQFQLKTPREELLVKSVDTDVTGLTHIKVAQEYHRVPVWASGLTVHLDRENRIYMVEGRYIPTPEGIDLSPKLSMGQVFAIVSRELSRPGAACDGCKTARIIHSGKARGPVLAFQVVTGVGYEFIIDADSGEILEKIPTFQK